MYEFGFQLSSIAPYLTTEEQIRSSLQKIAEIGYKAVQLQSVPDEVEDAVIRQALADAHLDCIALQVDYPDGFGEDPERAIRRALTCGCRYLTVAVIPWDVDSVEKLNAFAVKLNRIYELITKAGLIFAFHPIGPDFRLMDGVPVYERLMRQMPADMQLTFCVHSTFGSTVTYEEVLDRYKGRVDLVHFKDSILLEDGKVQLMPLGEGRQDWKPVAQACERADVKWIFAEQEHWTRDAFDCAATSFAYLQSL